MKLMVTIPAYNEARLITRVLKSIKKSLKDLTGFREKAVVVIDDGSTDNTGILAVVSSDLVFTHVINQGLGAVISTAFKYAKKQKFDILVTFDADGQHRAEDLSKLIAPIVEGKADVVIGSRLLGMGTMPVSRKIVNILANLFTVISGGVRSTDSQSGLRAFGKTAIQKIRLKTRGMEVSSEILTQVKTHGLKYREISIPAIYTDYSQAKGQPLTNAPNVLFRLFFRIIR